jgi:hypothetical protein
MSGSYPLIYREVGVVDPISQNCCGIGFSDPGVQRVISTLATGCS